MTFGEYVQMGRIKKGMTYEELAKETRMTRQAIDMIISGDTKKPHARSIGKLVCALDLDIEEAIKLVKENN